MDQDQAEKLLALVKENYRAIAADFDLTRKKAVWSELKEFVSGIQAGSRVLDAGCGNGRLWEILKDKPVDYLGFDNSRALLQFAQKNYPECRFVESDILDIDKFIPADFDYVFCLAVLQHIPSQKLQLQAINNLASRLKPGGTLVISVWNLRRQRKYRALIFKNYWLKIWGRRQLGGRELLFPWKSSSGKVGSQRYYHVFTKAEMRSLARESGLSLTQLSFQRYNYWLLLQK